MRRGFVRTRLAFCRAVTLPGNLEPAAQKVLLTGSGAVWERFGEAGRTEARQSLLACYRSLGVLTIVGAGLVNGLNACSFDPRVFPLLGGLPGPARA